MTKILFLGCNTDQVPYLSRLRSLGFTVIGTDMNSSTPGAELCDRFYNVGYEDFEKLIEVGKKEKFNSKDFVFTAAAQFAHRGASFFAEQFSIAYPKLSDIDLCLDKSRFYPYFKQHGIPLPLTWMIQNQKELELALEPLEPEDTCYLKSDFSKNPHYVYHFSKLSLDWGRIFWGRDRYLRNYYILQREYVGHHLRVNIFGEDYNVFSHDPSLDLQDVNSMIPRTGMIEKLRGLMSRLGMSHWLIKFDVIMSGKEYVVLDIGLDPPFRMKAFYDRSGLGFVKDYVNQYLCGQLTYPKELTHV